MDFIEKNRIDGFARIAATTAKDQLNRISTLFGMDKWLQNFQYRIDMTIWIFALAFGLSLAIALITVSWQSIRAAVTNPADTLRYE